MSENDNESGTRMKNSIPVECIIREKLERFYRMVVSAKNIRCMDLREKKLLYNFIYYYYIIINIITVQFCPTRSPCRLRICLTSMRALFYVLFFIIIIIFIIWSYAYQIHLVAFEPTRRMCRLYYYYYYINDYGTTSYVAVILLSKSKN